MRRCTAQLVAAAACLHLLSACTSKPPDLKGDLSFGANSRITISASASSEGRALASQKDGAVIVAGSPGIFRISQQGSIDRTFGDRGIARPTGGHRPVASVAVDSDDRILVAFGSRVDGSHAPADPNQRDYRVQITRLLPDGDVDPTFGSRGTSIVRLPQTRNDPCCVWWDAPSQRAIVAGHSGDLAAFIAAVRENGRPDVSFGDGGVRLFDLANAAFARSAAGTFVVSGAPATGSTAADLVSGPSTVIRLDATGAFDTRFGNGGMMTLAGNRRVLAIDDQQRLLTRSVDTSARRPVDELIRLTPAGEVDPDFGAVGGFDRSVITAAGIDSEKRVIVTGTEGPAHGYVFRYLDDGRRDDTFGPGVDVGELVQLESIVFGRGGRFVVVGTARERGGSQILLQRF